MTGSRSTELQRLTRAELVQMARAAGIRGASRLKKADLVRRLRALPASDSDCNRQATHFSMRSGVPADSSDAAGFLRRSGTTRAFRSASAVTDQAGDGEGSAAIVRSEAVDDSQAPRLLSVRPTSRHWCEVRWSVTRDQLRVAEAALGPERHHVSAVLHLERVGTEEEKALPRVELIRRVPVDLDEGCWYVRIDRPDECWQLRLGLESTQGRFQPLMHSPRFCPSQLLSRAMRLRPGSESPLPVQYSAARTVRGSSSSEGAEADTRRFDSGARASMEVQGPPLSLRLLLTLLGQCGGGCTVRFDGVPVDVAPDGSFEIPLTLHDGREVLPLSVVAPDGAMQWMHIFTVELRQQQLTPQHLDGGR